MSFNSNDINLQITSSNYEEYFLMYVDEELDAAGKAAVEAFVHQHPALREELDLLLSTRLPVDTITSLDKEFLWADSMKLNSVDESLLLYLDDELPAQEKEAVAATIAATPDLQFQYALLQKTKLDKEVEIIYPYKKELYRTTKKVKPLYWMQAAAIVLLIAGAGTITWFATKPEVHPSAFIKPIQQQPSVTPATTPIQAIPTQPTVQNLAVQTKKPSVLQQAKGAEKKIVIEKKLSNSPSNIEEKEAVAVIKNEPVNVPVASVHEPVVINETLQQNNNKQPVTTATLVAYNNTDTPDVIDAAAVADSKRGRAIRGLLRKATRFIERTTNIDPVNEDDKLLIGAVALKLK